MRFIAVNELKSPRALRERLRKERELLLTNSGKPMAIMLNGMTPRDLARCIEMAVNGTKSAYPALQPPGAFLRDLETMLRTLIAGAVRPAAKPRAEKPKPAKKVSRTIARKTGDRR